MRSSSADEAIRLIPHRELSLEQAIELLPTTSTWNHAEIHPPAQESFAGQQAAAPLAGNSRQPATTKLTGGPSQCADFSSQLCQILASKRQAFVCVPCPRVSSLMGIKTKRAFSLS